MLMGASATRGTFTFTLGALVNPVSANSSTSGGYSPEVRFICSTRASLTTLTTYSPVALTFLTVSLATPSREPAENITVGGLEQTALKKLNGARLCTPSELTDDTHAIGRGTTQPMSTLYAADGVCCGSICTAMFPRLTVSLSPDDTVVGTSMRATA